MRLSHVVEREHPIRSHRVKQVIHLAPLARSLQRMQRPAVAAHVRSHASRAHALKKRQRIAAGARPRTRAERCAVDGQCELGLGVRLRLRQQLQRARQVADGG
eukprot:scaffold5305_cov107-Isochrysis_galbana.AAC.4